MNAKMLAGKISCGLKLLWLKLIAALVDLSFCSLELRSRCSSSLLARLDFCTRSVSLPCRAP